MKTQYLAIVFAFASFPAFAAGLPLATSVPTATGMPALPTQLGNLPTPPIVVDLGASLPGVGSPQQFAPSPTVLPGLGSITPYFDNTGSGGRINTDVEVDVNGDTSKPPVIIYALAFTDPLMHPLHLIGNINGIQIDKRVDFP